MKRFFTYTAPCFSPFLWHLDYVKAIKHNYSSHFMSLNNLSQGDEITFTDMDRNLFRYEVAALEVLSPFAVEGMTTGDWDLTPFTCTVGGQFRTTIRCESADSSAQ